jgi:hypothetical protein
MRFDTINGLPGIILSGPRGLVQTNAFEIEDDVVKVTPSSLLVNPSVSVSSQLKRVGWCWLWKRCLAPPRDN